MRIDKAVYSGDLVAVSHYLNSGGDPGRLVEGRPLLVIAFQGRGRMSVAEKLIAAGADINSSGPTTTTALMEAALWGDAEAVVWLLRNGADPKLKDGSGRTALMYFAFSAQNNIQPTFDQFVAAGASPCDIDSEGKSVADNLVDSGHSELAENVRQICKG